MSARRTAVLTAGIDVSSYQGSINWALVASVPMLPDGTSFVFIKATEDAHFVDSRFAENWKAAKANGITRGAYHFFRPKTAVADQISNFVRTVGKLSPGDLPPVLDLEVPEDWQDIAQPQRVQLALQWLEGVEAALGVRPMVYLSPSFITDVIGTQYAAPLANYLLWIANYTSASQPQVPTPWTTWTFWQYSDTGSVNGISGDVDMDRHNPNSVAIADLKVRRKRRRPAVSADPCGCGTGKKTRKKSGEKTKKTGKKNGEKTKKGSQPGKKR